MPDTRNRPREGAMRLALAGYRPNPMLEDSWVACPMTGCDQGDGRPCNERDDSAWFNYAKARFQCRNGHEFTERSALIEVASR